MRYLAKVEESIATRFFESLTKMLNVVIAGKAPREMAEHVAGGRLFAFETGRLRETSMLRRDLKTATGESCDESRFAQA